MALADRFTKRRLAVLAGLVVAGIVVLLVGDPVAHPEVGTATDGSRGLEGVPRLAEILGITIAIVLALPPSPSDG